MKIQIEHTNDDCSGCNAAFGEDEVYHRIPISEVSIGSNGKSWMSFRLCHNCRRDLIVALLKDARWELKTSGDGVATRYLRVRRLSDGEEIHKVETTERQAERVMMGMLINMNTDEYYIDDSDFDTNPDANVTKTGETI